mmetsp:Transcript_64057/g.150724  ORF Transcript_64057/g.150724 Transcript_64057/m.150724 type:complete len:283 (-) Transcript_64057:27-875(-)
MSQCLARTKHACKLLRSLCVKPVGVRSKTVVTNLVVAQIKMSQRLALPQRPGQPLNSLATNPVAAQVKMSQRLALLKYARKPPHSRRTNAVGAQIEMSQRLAAPQHVCKRHHFRRVNAVGAQIKIAIAVHLLSTIAMLSAPFSKRPMLVLLKSRRTTVAINGATRIKPCICTGQQCRLQHRSIFRCEMRRKSCSRSSSLILVFFPAKRTPSACSNRSLRICFQMRRPITIRSSGHARPISCTFPSFPSQSAEKCRWQLYCDSTACGAACGAALNHGASSSTC